METWSPDALIAGDDYITDDVTVVSGSGVLTRGTLLGTITATGKLKPCLSTNTDGSQAPTHILQESIDATSVDVNCSAIVYGEINAAAVIFQSPDTAATHKAALRTQGIYLKTTQS